MSAFNPKFTITNRMTQAITRIERARGFLEAACLPSGPHRQAQLSADWVREVGEQALILEAHHTTHIEGTRLTLDQAERLWKGEAVPEADPDDARELLNYRTAFEFVSECLDSGLPAPPPHDSEFCIYVLKCSDGSFYIGQSENFPKRLAEHRAKKVVWTAPRLPVEPIHWEVFDSREEAVKREKDLKTGFGRKWLKREYERGGLAGSSRQAGDPITEGMIREIHRKLVEGVRGGSAAPGEYRRIQNYVVNAGTGQVIYTPPTAVEVPVMMSDLVKWLNGDLDIHPVLVSGIAQFQLVHIHPFLDGNGRASRLLSTLCLYKAGYDFKRLFTISEYYDRDRPTFFKSIQSVRDNGMDMSGWLDYFVTGLETQMVEVRERSEQVIRRDVLVKQHGLNERQGKALGYLLQHGKLTIQDFEALCPTVNRRSLQRDLKGMLDKDLITAKGATNQLVYRLAG
jgi:Fic family protein